MKANEWSGCIDQCFLDLCTSWRRMVCFNPRKIPRYPLIGGWVDPRASLDDVEKWISLVLPGLEVPFLAHTASRYADCDTATHSLIWLQSKKRKIFIKFFSSFHKYFRCIIGRLHAVRIQNVSKRALKRWIYIYIFRGLIFSINNPCLDGYTTLLITDNTIGILSYYFSSCRLLNWYQLFVLELVIPSTNWTLLYLMCFSADCPGDTCFGRSFKTVSWRYRGYVSLLR
jgi:hypothetical protein